MVQLSSAQLRRGVEISPQPALRTGVGSSLTLSAVPSVSHGLWGLAARALSDRI